MDLYEKKRLEYREKQKDIETKTARLRLTDEQYYVTAEYLLKLASKASELFASSEMHEKRQLLKLSLQNPTLKGKKVCYNWIKPFATIANYASRSAWLENRNYNITTQLACIFKTFEDFRLVAQIREEIEKVKVLDKL